jgi:DNA repair exonuclease SbcCD nuclease subunit
MHAIILGDVHLGKSLALGKVGIGSLLNSRVADQLKLLEWTLERAIEHSADHIIITGDCFEEPKPHPGLITMFIGWLKTCQAYHIHVHIIMGNHDLFRSGSILSSSLDIISEMDLDHVTVYKQTDTIFLGSSAITLMPFRDRKSYGTSSNQEAIDLLRQSLIYELASIPPVYKKFLVGHLAIEGSIPIGDEIDDITNELFCPLDMFQGYSHVWMGHIHKPQIMQHSSPYIAHTGSMDISNFGETDQEKSIIILDLDSSTQDFITEVLPTRPLKRLTVTVPKDTEDPTAYVLDEIQKAESDFARSIVRVEVSLAAPELKSVNKGQIEKFLTDQGAFNVTGISESKKVSLIKKDGATSNLDTKMDVITAINTYADKYVDAGMRADYIETAIEVYNQYRLETKE